MLLITSAAMLRKRTTGTLERLLTTPMHKLDLLVGYGLAFALAAAVQAAMAYGLAYWLPDLDTAGSGWTVARLAIGNAILGMAIGLLVSAFARSEFQAVQFMPAFVMPQMLLCGLIWSREQMADCPSPEAVLPGVAGVLCHPTTRRSGCDRWLLRRSSAAEVTASAGRWTIKR
jgi:ABC-2 type transport system permease protein